MNNIKSCGAYPRSGLAVIPVAFAIAVGLLLVCASVPAAGKDGAPKPSIRVVVDSKDPGHMHADAPLASPAHRVWEVISALERWPAVFSDVRYFKVLRRSGNRVAAEMDSIIMEGEADLKITVTPGRKLRWESEGHGIRMAMEFTVSPASGEKAASRSSVRVELWGKTVGFLGAFIPGSMLIKAGDKMVRSYLADLVKAL